MRKKTAAEATSLTGLRLSRSRLAIAVSCVLAMPIAAKAQNIDLANLGDAGFVINGALQDDQSGAQVSGAGDVNGDGLADLIVGAASADLAGESSGVTYVVFGRTSTDAIDLASLGTGGFIIRGAAEGDFSGAGVSGAGDVNGDGLADLIVGASRASPGGEFSGASYVVFGKADSNLVDLASLGSGGFVINGAAERDFSGGSVSGAGDVNGDGLADLIVGATGAEPEGEFSGASYVVFGKAGSDAVDLATLGNGGFVINGAALRDFSGTSVSGAGDVNGDGLADLIVGASGADPAGESSGTSYVVFGKTDGGTVDLADLGSEGFAINGAAEGDISGARVSGAGDVNGDGLADLIVSAYRAEPAGYDSGTSYVVFGKFGNGTVDLADLGTGGFAIEGATAFDTSGSSVGGAGDVNGDGLADLIVGAGGAEPAGLFSGASYLVFGKTDSDTVDLASLGTGGFVINGAAEGDNSGRSVSGAGDVNGDGLADFIVGAFGAPAGDFFGASYVIFSQETPNLSAAYRAYARSGDATRLGVGVSGDGSNDDSPDSRVWIDFDDGSEFGSEASLHEVQLNRSSGPYADAAADVHWQIQTSRTGWSNAELTFRYTDDELLSIEVESELQLVRATTPSGPYTMLPSVVNPADNTISAVVEELGFFFITEAQGEIELRGNGNSIADGDATPSATDHTDFGDVPVGQTFTRTFTIRNDGVGTLTITDSITSVGEGFSVSQPASDTLAPNSLLNFDVTFAATDIGAVSAIVNIPNSDDDEDPFTFAIRANGVADDDLIFGDGFE